jgi:hypothetical protein
MPVRFTLILLLLPILTSAQVTNSTSKNKTGLYTHALDSVISLIKKDTVLHKIYIAGDECVRNAIPDTLQGVVIEWTQDAISNDKLKPGELTMAIRCLHFIRNEVVIMIVTPRQGDWAYRFQYYYQTDTKDYLLKRLDKGLRI